MTVSNVPYRSSHTKVSVLFYIIFIIAILKISINSKKYWSFFICRKLLLWSLLGIAHCAVIKKFKHTCHTCKVLVIFHILNIKCLNIALFMRSTVLRYWSWENCFYMWLTPPVNCWQWTSFYPDLSVRKLLPVIGYMLSSLPTEKVFYSSGLEQ